MPSYPLPPSTQLWDSTSGSTLQHWTTPFAKVSPGLVFPSSSFSPPPFPPFSFPGLHLDPRRFRHLSPPFSPDPAPLRTPPPPWHFPWGDSARTPPLAHEFHAHYHPGKARPLTPRRIPRASFRPFTPSLAFQPFDPFINSFTPNNHKSKLFPPIQPPWDKAAGS